MVVLTRLDIEAIEIQHRLTDRRSSGRLTGE